MGFKAHEIAKQIVSGLRDVIAKIYAQDRELADQLKRAATSMVLNMGEGSRRTGRDRIQHYKIAAGSAAESRDALEIAVAWRYLEAKEVAMPLDGLDQVLAILWRVRHRGA